MRIGFIATRIAGVDGVSLEIGKLAHVLEEMGHECFYCAGELDREGKAVPRIHFQSPVAIELYQAAFSNPVPDPVTLEKIYAEADAIREALYDFIDEYNIDMLISQNASCIPMNISLGVAIAETVKRRQIPTIGHHHDFYWERDRFLSNGIQDILNEAFPPTIGAMQHMVINTNMQRRLKAWRGIESHYLPNVFDFETAPPPPDTYARSFREVIGLSDDDLIVLQPTRIIRRKSIEKAIELMRKLEDNRLVFIVTGYEGDEAGEYGVWLREEAERAGIRYQFIGDYVDSHRGERNGHPVFTLWDIYPHAHFITYPSTYEGFGNALLETVYFRKPFIVHRYGVYLSDIKPAGIQAIEFTHDITDDVLNNVRHMIDDAGYRERMTTHNYDVGIQHFSYQILRKTLPGLLHNLSL